MSYGMFEMQMEDEQAHEDGMAIAAGMMCSFCLSVMHVATSEDTCPRMQEEENMATYQVIEYRSTADTYEVEASSEEDAENQVAEGMGTLIPGLRYEEHDFYEVKEN